MRVMSISSSIFSRGGSLTGKEELPLKATTRGGSWLGLRLLSAQGHSSMETLTASQVSTLDWNIRKSEFSMLTRTPGENSFTQMWLPSDEYSTWKTISLGCLKCFCSTLISLRIPTPSISSSASLKGRRSRSLRRKLNLTRLPWSLSAFLMTSKPSGLMSRKKASRLSSISRSFSLTLASSCSLLFLLFSLWYSTTSASSVFLLFLRASPRFSWVLMQSISEQFLMRQSIEWLLKASIFSTPMKKAISLLMQNSFSRMVPICSKQVSTCFSSSASAAVSSLCSLFLLQFPHCSSSSCPTFLQVSIPRLSAILPASSRYHSTTRTFLSLGRPPQHSSTRRSTFSWISGVTWWLRHEYRKYPSSTPSCSSAYVLSRQCGSLVKSASGLEVLRVSRVRSVQLCRRCSSTSPLPCTTAASRSSSAVGVSSSSIMQKLQKPPQPRIELGSPA